MGHMTQQRNLYIFIPSFLQVQGSKQFDVLFKSGEL